MAPRLLESKDKIEAAELSHHLVRVEDMQNEDEAAGARKPTPVDRLRRWLVILLFVIPVAGSVVYNFMIAKPRYAAEMSFVVRTSNASASRFSLLNLAKSNGQDDSEAIVAFIRSRELLNAIDRDGYVRNIFASQDLDFFSAFPSLFAGSSKEDFYRHFQRFINADFDRGTSITTVEVQAPTAEVAHEIAKRILNESEGMVNRLNARARSNLVVAAEGDLRDASANLTKILGQMNAIRKSSGIIETKMQAGAAIKLSSATEAERAAINVQLRQTQLAAPNSPLIGQLKDRKAAISAELGRQNSALVGNPQALASRMRGLDEINAQREIAEKRVLAASLGLLSARNSADRQQLYVERIANPNLPDEPLYPRAWRNLLYTILIAGALLMIGRSLAELVASDE